MKYRRNLGEKYSPLYFLGATAAGGLAISFFLYLTLIHTRRGFLVPNFSSLYGVIENKEWTYAGLLIFSLTGCLFFLYEHIQLLLWNVRHFKLWQQTPTFSSYKESPACLRLMSIHLTLSVTLNLLFLLVPVFIPAIWQVRDYLFPLAFLTLAILAHQSLKLFFSAITRTFSQETETASKDLLGSVLCALTFASIGLGFSTIASFSQLKVFALTGYFVTLFFLLLSLFVVLTPFFGNASVSLRAPLRPETATALWGLLPLSTLMILSHFRLDLCIIRQFNSSGSTISQFVFWGNAFAFQLFLGCILTVITKHLPDYRDWIKGHQINALSYMVVCVGLSLFVTGQFFLNEGIAITSFIPTFSWIYFILCVPLLTIQLWACALFLRINKRFFARTIRKESEKQAK